MSNNKSQHYVPVFFLRYFANPDGRSIRIFNLVRRKLIPDASLKDQACRDWFYGKDLLIERAFGSLEGAAAKVLDTVVRHNRLPQRYSQDHHTLISFVALQLARTEAAETEINNMATKLGRTMLSHTLKDPELIAFLPNIRIISDRAVHESMRIAVMGIPILYDLKYKLILNKSDRPFIMSDAPIVLHNRIFESNEDCSALGFACVGLQIWMPVGPRRAILFYDEGAYTAGTPLKGTIAIQNPDHCQLINDLQWESAQKNLYVSSETNPIELTQDAGRWLPFKQADNTKVTDHILENCGHSKRGRLITLSRRTSVVQLALPHIKARLTAPKNMGPTEIPPVRSVERTAIAREAWKNLEAGRITFEQYWVLTNRALLRRR